MRLPLLVLPFALALGLASLAHGQSFSSLEERMSAADFRRAGLDKLSDEELAALNDWLSRHATEGPSTAPQTDTTGFPSAGFFSSEPGSDRIVSNIVGSFSGWNGAGDLITLANGQVWRVTDSSTRLRVQLSAPRVTIERNALGGWQLRVDGYNTRARVIRVR